MLKIVIDMLGNIIQKIDLSALYKVEIGAVSLGAMSSLLEVHLFNYGITDPGWLELADLVTRSAIGATTGAVFGLLVHGVWKNIIKNGKDTRKDSNPTA